MVKTMGGPSSGRKASDEAIIRLKKKKTKGGGPAGSSSSNYEKVVGCPQVFKVNLPSEPKLSEGSLLTLRTSKGKLTVFYANISVANLDASLQKEIVECIKYGFRYDGVVKTDEKGNYAEFHRTAA